MKRVRIFSALSVVILLVIACDNKPKEEYAVFRWNSASEIGVVDPAFASNQSRIWVSDQLFTSLFDIDSNLELYSKLISEYSKDTFGLTYTFTMKEGRVFYDPQTGNTHPILAKDAVYTLNRLLDPEVSASGKWTLQDVGDITLVNDTMFTVSLQRANASFLQLLSTAYTGIVSSSDPALSEDKSAQPSWFSGPFYLQVNQPGEIIILRRNPTFSSDYPGPFLDAIHVTFIKDKFSEFIELAKGNLDMISGMDEAYRSLLLNSSAELKAEWKKKLRIRKTPFLNTEYLGFFVGEDSPFPYNNADFRKAVELSIDKKAMMRYLRHGIGEPAERGIVPPVLSGSKNHKVSYHRDSAMAYLEKSNYIDQGRPKISLHTNPSYRDLCVFVQAALRGIGVECDVEVHPPSTLRSLISSQEIYFFRASWIADFPDPINYLSLFDQSLKSPVGPNYTHYGNPEFQEMLQRYSKTINTQERRTLLSRMENTLQRETPVIPLYYDESWWIYSKEMEGLSANAMNFLDMQFVRKNSP